MTRNVSVMNSCVISDVVGLESSRDNPILLAFQNAEMGYKDDSKIQCFRAEDVNRAAAQGQPKPSRMAVVVAEQQLYRGYVGEGLGTEHVNTYVAVRNRTSGKMRLIQLEPCTMLHCCYDDNSNKFQTATDEIDLAEQRKFAGKVGQRALDRITRSGRNLDVLNETIQDTVQKFDNERFADDNKFAKTKLEGELILGSIKPPRNLKANTPAEMYQLEDMVSLAILLHLRKVALELMEKDPGTLVLANVYLTNKVKAALQSKEPDSDENIQVILICLVMDALCRLLELRTRSLPQVTLSSFSSQLDAEVKRKFSQINHHKQLKTKYTEHKALTHYLALAFALENCVLSVDQIHAGLSIAKSDLLKFAAFLGATYNSTKNTLTLRMTDPVDNSATDKSFQKNRRFGRNRK